MFSKKMITEKTNDSEIIKDEMINLFDKSNKYIWMSSGFNQQFYSDVEILSAMEKAFERVKEVKIIIQDDIIDKDKLNWLFDFKSQFGDKIQIKQNVNASHWTIIDGKHFRLEKLHKHGEINNHNLFINNMVYDISNILKEKYEDWWFQGEDIVN